jgi:hypothetical protein
MAETKDPQIQISDEAIGKLAGAISSGIVQSQPAKKIEITDYKVKTPWNPEGNTKRPTLSRQTLQNGYEVSEHFLTDEEIRLFNELKPGRYLNRKIEVIVRESENGSADTVDLRYPNKTIDQRYDLKALASNLEDLLRKIIAEQ